jgi:glycosyltransferase involved in cell wall biosynthesis
VKVSVLLPTRDRPDWIGRAIQSVIRQTSPDWELVVLDNGAESVERLMLGDKRIRYIREPASGPADAFQKALVAATGDLCLPMGDDDELAADAVETIIDAMGSTPSAEWGHALTTVFHDGNVRYDLGGPLDLAKLRADYYLGGAVWWRKSLTDRLGGFDSNFDGAADYDLYLRFAEDSTPVFVPEVLYHYTDHPLTDSNAKAQRQQESASRIRARVPAKRVSVVTPWKDHPELRDGYARAVERVDNVVIAYDGDGDVNTFHLLRDFYSFEVLDATEAFGFAGLSNAGLAASDGDIVVMLNNDVEGPPGWVDAVRRQVVDGALYGPSIGTQTLAGIPVPYVEGWCVAATRATWDMLGGWDAEAFPKPYWEDVDLSVRAIRAGLKLKHLPLPLRHLGGTTTGFPDERHGFDDQRAVVEQRVAEMVGVAV